MSGGGKGGKTTTEVQIPDWLESAARSNIGRAENVAGLGYTPYYGPDVAAMTPMQTAAGQGINTAAGAFGLGTADLSMGMPAPQTFAGGVQGYSSGGLYDQSLAELQRRAPGQYNAMTGMFINPQTGAAPLSFGSSVPAMPPMAAPAPVVAPVAPVERGGGDRAPLAFGGGGSSASSPAATGGFTGIRDMFDGGGAGASGTTFSGGPLSGIANRVGISPVSPASPAPAPAPAKAVAAAPARSAPAITAGDRVADKALAGKAAVQAAKEVGKALQGNRAADKALADKAAKQSEANRAAANKSTRDAAQGKGGKSGPSSGGKSSGGSNATRR